jgi:hypothetical protein
MILQYLQRFFFTILNVVYAIRSKEFTVKNAFLFFSGTLGSFVILIFLVTGFHPFELLRFNFLDVTRDQWWYFGYYSERSRVFSFLDLYKIVDRDVLIALVAFCLTFFLSIRKKSFRLAMVAWIGGVLFFGGLLPSVGGHIADYFNPFIVWSRFVLIFLLLMGSYQILIRYFKSPVEKIVAFKRRYWSKAALIGSSAFFLAYGTNFVFDQINLSENDEYIHVTELGGYLSYDWSPYVAQVRANKDKIVYEEYWGIWSAITRKFNKWKVDSIIHALGSVREKAIADLEEAEIMITTRYDMSNIWTKWNHTQNYWFYEPVITRAEIMLKGPNTVVWDTGPVKRELPLVEHYVAKDKEGIVIPEAQRGFYEVTIFYETDQNRRALYFFDNEYAFAAHMDGGISLNPYSGKAKFPAYYGGKDQEDFKLQASVLGPNDPKIKILKAEVKRIENWPLSDFHGQ